MRSVKLTLVLIIFGIALLVVAFVPGDTDGSAATSSLGSWGLGLLGAALLGGGLVLLRRGYQAARQAQGGGPMPVATKVLLVVVCVAALAAIAFMATRDKPRASASALRTPGARTKANDIEEGQRENRKRQSAASTNGPAPAPLPELPH